MVLELDEEVLEGGGEADDRDLAERVMVMGSW